MQDEQVPVTVLTGLSSDVRENAPYWLIEFFVGCNAVLVGFFGEENIEQILLSMQMTEVTNENSAFLARIF